MSDLALVTWARAVPLLLVLGLAAPALLAGPVWASCAGAGAAFLTGAHVSLARRGLRHPGLARRWRAWRVVEAATHLAILVTALLVMAGASNDARAAALTPVHLGVLGLVGLVVGGVLRPRPVRRRRPRSRLPRLLP